MKTVFKVCIVLIIIGGIAGLAGLVLIDFNFDKLEAFAVSDKDFIEVNQVTEVVPPLIRLDLEYNNVVFSQSGDEKIHITYYVSEEHYSVSYEANASAITITGKQLPTNWYKRLVQNVTDKASTVTIKLPADYNGTLEADASYGNISLQGFHFLEKISLDTSFGDMNIRDITVNEELKMKTSHGNYKLENINAPKGINATTSFGNVTLKKIDSPVIYVKTSHGNTTLEQVAAETSVKIETSYGEMKAAEIRTPTLYFKTSHGNIKGSGIAADRSDLLSSYGNITVELKGVQADYKLQLTTSYGDKYVAGNKTTDTAINSAGVKAAVLDTSHGNIHVTFA